MSESTTDHKTHLFLKRLVLLLGAVMICGVLLELAFRACTALFMPNYTSGAICDRSALTAALEEGQALQRKESANIVHPFLGHVHRPGTDLSWKISADRLARQVGPGQRPEWLGIKANNVGFICEHDMPYRREPDDYVIVVVGGSVAEWFVLQGGRRFAQRLKADERFADRSIVILNCAAGGRKQPQQVMTVAYMLALGLRADAVINIDGFNEAGLSYGNLKDGIAPTFPVPSQWAHLLSGFGLSPGLMGIIAEKVQADQKHQHYSRRAQRLAPISNLLAYVYIRRAEHWHSRSTHKTVEYQNVAKEEAKRNKSVVMTGPYRAMTDDEARRHVVAIWANSSKSLAGMCRANGLFYLHVLQPTGHETIPVPSKPLTPEERKLIGDTNSPWAAGARTIYPLMKRRASKFVDERVNFADLSMIFASNTDVIYYDICHYNQAGNIIFADGIAEAFLKSLGQ